MSLEQAIEKLTAALEAATGVLVALGATPKAAAPAAAAPAASTPAPAPAKGSKKAAAPAPAAPPADDGGGLGGDGDDGGLGGDDGGLGGDDDGPTVSPEEAKAAVLAYRDKAIKVKGKDEGLSATRTLMKKHVQSLDEIKDANAAEVHAVFTAAIAKLK